MTYKEQIFISKGCVTFESLHTFEKIYLHKSRNIHGFLMELRGRLLLYKRKIHSFGQMHKLYTLGTYFTSKIYKLASKYTTNQLGTSTT